MAEKSSPAGVLVAIDMGGTRLRAMLASTGGDVIRNHRQPTVSTGADSLYEQLYQMIERVLGDQPHLLCGISVGIAGTIDQGSGMVVSSPNLGGFRGMPLKKALGERFKVPVLLENDANVAAVGEHRQGAGRGTQDMLYLTVSTGIGGGLILGGKLYRGARGSAGELGHTVVKAPGPPCNCGKDGCLEALASGRAVAREAQEQLLKGSSSLLLQMSAGNPQEIDARLVGEAARQGDALSQEVLRQAAHYLGLGLASFINIFDPELIVLGGGLSNMEELYIRPAIKAARECAMAPAADSVRFAVAQLGDDAGLYGALSLLQDELALS